MASLLTRLANIFPGFRGRATLPPPPDNRLDRRIDLVARVKEDLRNTPSRARPSSEERVPLNWHGGIAGRVWFLPHSDSATKDDPAIRAAMRLMRRDPYVKAGWVPQILTVASEDWQVQPAESGNPESEEQADFCKAVIEEYLAGGMPQLVQSICAPFGSDGFCLAEKVWGVAERGRLERKVVCQALKARDADSSSVRLEGDRFGNVTHVQTSRTPGQPRFPITDFVYSRYLTVFDEPLGEAAFRPVYGSYWMRDTVRKLRVIHHEKKMGGFLKGTYQNDEDRAGLEAALRAAKTSTWAAVPEGVQIEAVNLSTATEPDYKSFDESLRDEIITGLAFATLQTIQGNIPDARGDSKVQKAQADLGPWLLMVLVSEAVNKQLFPDLIDFNFPYPAGGGYPKLTFGSISNAELLELVQLVEGYQRLGFEPSKKHYAKTLSVQESDPNDPEDILAAQQPGGFGGDPFGGAGMGAALPPADPFGGAGMEQFSENEWVEFREPVKWSNQGNGTWKSSGGRVLSDAAYQRHVARIQARREKQQATQQPAQQPAAVSPGNTPEPAARRGLGGRIVGAVARGAKALPAALATKGAQVSGKVAGAVQRLGEKAKKLKKIERRLGIGATLEKTGRKAAYRAAAVEEVLREGTWWQGQKEAARQFVRAVGVHFKESRRRYGVLPAVAIEGVMAAYSFGTGAVMATIGAAADAVIPSLGRIVAVAAKFAKMVVKPLIRQAVEFPFKLAAPPWGSYARAKRIRAIREANPANPANPAPAFAEFAEPDPTEMVVDLRTWADEFRASQGLPPIEATDEELAGVLSAVMDAIEESAADAFADAGCDYHAFADSGLSWESFAWQAARSRTGGIKAVGTAEHAGQVLYGQSARAALAREGGASRRQTAPRNVTYERTGEDGEKSRKREANVSPERARAMAIAGKVAELEGGDVGGVKTTKARKPPRSPEEAIESISTKAIAAIEGLAGRAARGDTKAAAELTGHAQATVEAAAGEVAAAPKLAPAEFQAGWDEATKSPGETPAQARVRGRIGNFFAGALGAEDARGVSGGIGRLVGWLARAGGKLAAFGAKTLWKFARWGLKQAGKAAGAVGRAAWRNGKPFFWWAGSLAAGAAVMAMPVLAVKYGLIIKPLSFALAPLAVYLGWRVGRRVGQRAIDEGLKITGNDAVARNSEFACGRPFGATHFAEGKDFALAGPDGRRAAELLKDSQAELGRLFAEKSRAAAQRMLASENPLGASVLFDDDELSEIAGGLARVITSADLLGRARIRRRAELAEKRAKGESFAEDADDPFHDFAEPVPPNLTPERAIDWFRTRVPAVSPGADRYGARLDRHATTLAIASDEVLLDRIKAAVLKELEGGGDATPEIEAVLESAGLNGAGAQYPEMLARTNAMLAYNQGAADELMQPDMREAFPAYEYLGVLDDRTGDDHRPKIGKYYPSTANFADVRGPRIWNCRCTMAPIHKSMADKVRVEERW
jgi:hypothetical protein